MADIELNSEENDVKLLGEAAGTRKEAEQLYRHLLLIEHSQASKTRRINLVHANAIDILLGAAFGDPAVDAASVDGLRERVWFARCLLLLVGNPDNEIQSVLAAIASAVVDVDAIGRLLQAAGSLGGHAERDNQEATSAAGQLAELAMDIATRCMAIVQQQGTAADLATSVQYLAMLQPCTAAHLPEGVRVKAMQMVLRILSTTSAHSSELTKAFVDSSGFEQLLLATTATANGGRIKALALMLLAKLAEEQPQRDATSRKVVEHRCAQLVGHWMEHGQAATRTTGLRVLSVLFQIDPSLALATLGPEGAQKLADVAELGEYETVEAQQALVDVLSYACDDKTCRGIVAGQCRQYLLARMRDTASLPMRIAAAIALTKIAQSSANEEHRGIEPAHRAALVEIFCEALRQPTDKWTISARAVEGLTYFSMDPSVKERISQDTRLLKGLSSMATSACETSPSDEQRNATLGNDQGISYGIASILRNITSYPVELTEEQKQLRKLRAMTQSSSARGSQGNGAKGDRPDEESPLDDQAHVERRVTRLLEADLLPTILRLARHTSPTVRESAAHCLHAIVTDKAHRGRMLQHGGARALLALATERIAAASEQATEPKAQPYAAHADIATQALAKLAITVDPRVGFPGELAKELVRPLVRICADAEQPSLRQFECLLALTNLASVAEDGGIAQRIVGEGGVDAASVLQFSRIALVQRAATELICNMMMYPAVAQIYAASQERVKLLVALTDTDDAPTRSAAAGALAILSAHPEGARAILARKQNIARMVGLLEEEDDDGLRHRGAECLRNVAALDKAAAEQVVEAKALLPALVAIIKTSTHPPLVQCAAQVLAVLQQHRLVSI